MLSICSCNGGKEKAKERARLDSLEQDSIRKAQAITDSLSLIAWGDTKFGMTKQEVMASKSFSGYPSTVKETGEDDYLMDLKKSSQLIILYHLYKDPSIYAHFRENELYQVTIESAHLYASEIEELANDCMTFTNEFSKRYGEPEYLRPTVSISDFKNHELKIASFKIGNKSIWIGLEEMDSEYRYAVYIENSTFPKKKHIPTDEELKEQKIKEAKDKELRENSF